MRGRTRCPICDALIAERDDVVSTSGGPIQPDDPLWTFQDAAMHRQCFRAWSQRDAFRARFNDYFEKHLRGMKFMREDGEIELRKPRSSTPKD
jgi:hypothetical protein